MNRLQKKCLAASTLLHGLLLVVLVVGAAFLSAPPRTFDLPILEVIPQKLLDAAIYGGGDPRAQPPPPAPPAEPPREVVPQPAPAEPTPTPTPAREPEPEVPPVTTARLPVEVVTAETRKPSKPQIQVSPPRKGKPSTTAPNRPAARTAGMASAERRAADDLARRFASVAGRLSNTLSSSTTIGIPGPGGEAFASYGQAVISIYERAWIKPAGVDETVSVKAEVVIARTGRVLSARITGPSSNRAVNESVERVLDRVKEIAPFPEGSKDESRPFTLNFELTPLPSAG
jgi:outer membrane biosynthesis protein TonB